MKLKPHPSVSQLHQIAGERENCLSVILYSRSASLASPLLCMRILHYTTKSTRSIILLFSVINEGARHQRSGALMRVSDTAANCLVF